MRYSAIASMCKPSGNVPGCPHDGLGCTGGEQCSINSRDPDVRFRAWNAEGYGRDFKCAKREWHLKRPT